MDWLLALYFLQLIQLNGYLSNAFKIKRYVITSKVPTIVAGHNLQVAFTCGYHPLSKVKCKRRGTQGYSLKLQKKQTDFGTYNTNKFHDVVLRSVLSSSHWFLSFVMVIFKMVMQILLAQN